MIFSASETLTFQYLCQRHTFFTQLHVGNELIFVLRLYLLPVCLVLLFFLLQGESDKFEFFLHVLIYFMLSAPRKAGDGECRK